MAKHNRLIPIRENNRLKGMITFYIGDNDDKFIRNNPWTLLDDNPEKGKTVYIDQLISDKEKNNYQCSQAVWYYLRRYFKEKFPQIDQIKWVRQGKRRHYVYPESFKRSRI